MKRLLALLLAGLVVGQVFAQSDDENPGSLWPSRFANPLLDRTAHRVGDVLTVLISENSSGGFSAQTTTSRNLSNSISQPNIPLLSQLYSSLSTSANGSSDGKGTTTQSGNLTARMSVVVQKVMPNGNLVVEGSRWVRVNKETMLFTLTGIVRREDIAADNTISSEKLANADVRSDGKGQVADHQRRGLLNRLLDWLF